MSDTTTGPGLPLDPEAMRRLTGGFAAMGLALTGVTERIRPGIRVLARAATAQRAREGWGERDGRCPECGYGVTLKHDQIPSHVPKGSRQRKLCAASGFFAAHWKQPGGDGALTRRAPSGDEA